MSTLASIAKKVSDGIFELKSDESLHLPLYGPAVVLCERDRIEKLPKADLPGIVGDNYRKGFYILFDTNLDKSKYNFFVGSGGYGTEKDSQTLFEAIHDQAKRNPDDSNTRNPYVFKVWDKAILVCDWEHDIQFRKIYADAMIQNNDKYSMPAVKAMNTIINSDVKLASSFCNFKLKEFENSGSIRITRNKQNRSNIFISNFYDSDRYEYYVHLALKFIKCLIPDFDKMPEPKIKVMDKLYAEFDSEAIVLENFDIEVKKFKIGSNWASEEHKRNLKKISRDAATRYIRQQNGKKPAKSANEFWHVIKENKLQPIKNFEFEK